MSGGRCAALWLTATLAVACGGGERDAERPRFEPITLRGPECSPRVERRVVELALCEEYEVHLEELHLGFGGGPFADGDVPYERHIDAASMDLPRVSEGWKIIPDYGGRDRDPAIVIRLHAGAKPGSLGQGRQKLRANPNAEVLLLAERGVPMARVARLRAEFPDAHWRLVVRKPQAAIVRTLEAAYSRTPQWVERFLVDCLGRTPAGHPAREMPLRNALRRAGGECNRAGKIFFLLDGGADLEIIGPAAAQMVRECECELTDLDAFVSLLAYRMLPIPDTAWIPLPAELPTTGRVGDWIASRR